MLDANLVLQEAEVLLDSHFIYWQRRTPGRVRVFEKPSQPPIARQETRALAALNGAGQQVQRHAARRMARNPAAPAKSVDVAAAVTSVFMFLFLTVLSDKLSRGRGR